MDLNGKAAIVTGGAVRLGREIAMGLARAGADVLVHYGRSAEVARDTAAAVEALGRRAAAVQADLTEPVQAARTIFEAAGEAFGHTEILVNSAAVFERTPFDQTTPDAWHRQFAINLHAPFCLCQEFARRLPPGTRGQIVNLVDWRALRPGAGSVVYTLTKSALVTLTRVLAQDLAPQVQVNAVAPGAILPPPDEGPGYLERLADRIPLGRPGLPQDVVEAVLFLLRSDFITGEVLHVTGGQEL
ncbi:MAG TPA: SDR family oxidoreductase [Planctomycetaceae bacterium]|nr:SDR family oxidoreductase [Planctomycetaceae bacterium]